MAIKKNTQFLTVTIGFVLFLIAASIIGLWAVIQSSRSTAENFGQQLSENYRLQNIAVLGQYRTILETGAHTIKSMRDDGRSIEEIQQWTIDYAFSDAEQQPSDRYTGLYSILDGKTIDALGWQVPESYAIEDRIWYQETIEMEEDSIHYSNVYQDAMTGQNVVTLSVNIGGGDAVAVDVNTHLLEQRLNQEPMMEGNIHVTFDRTGNIICHRCWDPDNCPHDAAYFQRLWQNLSAHETEESFQYQDATGSQQIVYSFKSNVGWLSVSSVSYNILSGSSRKLMNLILFIGVLYLGAAMIFLIRNYGAHRKAQETAAILYALGDTYYAIYLIHAGTGQCQLIKPSPDVQQEMAGSDRYDQLLSTLAAHMEPEAARQFCEDFSLDSIHDLMDKEVRSFGGDFQRRFEDGYEWVNVQLLLAGGNLHEGRIIFAFRKITEEKKQELQQIQLLEESLEAAKAGSQAKSSFLSNISHDMRTPLNAIIGFCELAIQQQNSEKTTGYLEKIRFSSRHLLQLINDTLDMARIEQGKLDFQEEAFNLEALCRETVDIFREQAMNQQKTLELTIQLTHSIVIGDPLRVGQILNNLLSNAVKFTHPGDRITLSLRQSQAASGVGLYQLVISDTGIGMSPEFLEKLFLPFEREVRFHPGRIAGTGLGMPIVQSIVQSMNGTIEVESKPGEGTTFTLNLPLQLDETAEVSSAPQPAGPIQLTGRHLLLAEDNEMNMEIAAEILEMNGALVTKAWNGQEAVEAFAQSPVGFFSVILMDMQMPVMDGCEATRQIRKMERPDATSVPIIAVTANAFADDISRVMEAGMNAHLAKPVDFTQLLETLTQLTDKTNTTP